MPYKNKKDLYTAQKNRWIMRKREAVRYKGGACSICGYSKHIGALEFHHRDPSNKKFSWTKLRLKAWLDVLEELNKCDLLCSNCHQEVTNRDPLNLLSFDFLDK